MAVNQVILGEDVVLDLTEDTVTAEDLPLGVTAHDKSGAKITGASDYIEREELPNIAVTSWNSRRGDVLPQDGDYSYEQIKGLKEQLELSKKGSTYVHKQRAVAKDWEINHNLNKYPSVTVADSAGTVVVGEVTYIDANTLTVSFSNGFSGTAYLN